MSPNILKISEQSIPSAVSSLLQPVVWSGEELAKKAAVVVQRVVYGGSGLKEAAKEAGLSVREARELAREGWFGELVSQAVGSKLVVMSEFRCARLRERMEMIEEAVEESRSTGDGDSLLKWLEQARKEMESGKGLEGVIEALGSRNGGPMIQVNIGRYEVGGGVAEGPCQENQEPIQAEYSVSGSEVEGDASQPEDGPEAAEETESIGYAPEDDSLDALLEGLRR